MSAPESLADVDLTTIEKYVSYAKQYPEDADRAWIFYLRARERLINGLTERLVGYERFRDETVSIVKQILKGKRLLDPLVVKLAQVAGLLDAEGASSPARAQASGGEADGPGYPPVDNLPFPTSGPVGAKPQPAVVRDGAVPAQGDGQSESQVVDVKPNAAVPGVPNNSRVTNVSPIPRGNAK